ncbi:hypothetical protein ACQZV8_14420 [Magnetococcales bacterium HHB-1]
MRFPKITWTKIAALALACLLCLQLSALFHIEKANLLSYHLRKYLAHWNRKAPPSEALWKTVFGHATQALETNPANPALYHQVGHMLALHARTLIPKKMRRKKNREQRRAMFFYRKAIKRAPARGLYWASIMIMRYNLHQIDPLFFVAWEKTDRWAPHERTIQLRLAEIGLAGYYRYPISWRKKVIQHVDKAISLAGVEHIKKMVKKHHRRTEILLNRDFSPQLLHLSTQLYPLKK